MLPALAVSLVLAAAPVATTVAPAAPLALSVDDAVARARAHSARLAQLRSLAEAADAGVRVARTARLPQLDLSAGYTRNSDVPELTLALPGQSPRTIFPNIPDTWRTRAGVGLPLYAGGRIAGGAAAARAQQEAARHDVDAGERDLVLETTVAYWALVTARESERVLAEAIAAYEKHLADARNREAVGLAARNEVLAVDVERDRADLARIQARNAAAVSEADLARLVGLPAGTSIDPVTPAAAPLPATADVGALTAAAFDARPELRALQSRVAAAEANVSVQRAAGLPQAGLAASYDVARPNTRILPLTDAWNDTWSVGINLSWNAFDGGRAAAATAQARAQVEALRQQLEDVRRRVQLEVTQRALDLDGARAALEVAERALVSGRENVRVAGDRYREGVGSSTDLLDAETGLLRAGLDRTAALAGAQAALAGLQRAVGRRGARP